MGTNFLLFDIDGVLINPSGYRKAVFDTTSYFLNKLGFSKISINEEIITTFESIGITSEWDMVPLYLLSIIELSLIQKRPDTPLENYSDSYNFFRKREIQPDQNEIILFVLILKDFLQEGYSACDSLINQDFENKSSKVFINIRSKIPWILNDWLMESRNIWKSKILQYFQNLTLGSELFQGITGLDAIIDCEPYLTKYDSPLISDEIRNTLASLHSKKYIFPSVITARPSTFPNGIHSDKSQLNFPEAELALKCLKLEEIPCVGFGTLEYLGKLNNSSGDQFVKPSPVHAMTAVLFSSGMQMDDAIKLSYDYFFNDQHKEIVDYLSQFPSPINVFIFEDSIIGIQSLDVMGEQLTKDGFKITTISYGISTNKNKIEALEKENAIIFPTINEAFSACVEAMKI